MLEKLKKLWNFLNEDVSITLIPSSKYETRNFRTRIIVFTLILVLAAGTAGTLTYLTYYYRTGYLEAREEFDAFKAMIDNENLKEENTLLKKELYTLNRETEQMLESLEELKDFNSSIKNMIADKPNTDQEKKGNLAIEFTPLLAYNQSLLQQGTPAGGKEINLYYQQPEKVIAEMRENINVIKEEIYLQEEEMVELEQNVEKYNEKEAATPSIWPLADRNKAYISDEFGWRIHPITNTQEFHEGLDIATWYNTPVLAAADGIVKYAGWSSGYGYLIKIDHQFGYRTYYAHLNKFKVNTGERVKKGQIIALSGNSGRSTGPHLHYEVRENNIPQNPREYIGR